ncbi:MAG: hypothetical protein MJ052_01770, partial [Sphaerochaetaceae bacterium]|nr:hypothetical protein [Sphaerochaetaceae bacterium]
GKLCFEIRSSFKDVFIPVSVIKQIRREFYSYADSKFESYVPVIPKCPEPEKFIPDSSAVHLEPVMFSEKEYYKSLENTRPMLAGLNNVAHVMWAKQHPETQVFADVFLYAHNRFAYCLLKEELPNLAGVVSANDVPSSEVPLFISRVCYRHNALGKSCENCKRDSSYRITQNGKHYKVHCKNCITVVAEAD